MSLEIEPFTIRLRQGVNNMIVDVNIYKVRYVVLESLAIQLYDADWK